MNRLMQLMKLPQMPSGGIGGGIAAVLGLGGAGFLGYKSLYTVEGGHRAVIFNAVTGVREDVAQEGTHFLIPYVESPIFYDVRAKPRNLSSLTGSRDLQMVNITLRVLSKPDPMRLQTIYRTLGTDYDERVLPSIVNEVLKSVVAQFNAAQLITQREQVSRLVRRRLVERARDFHIVLDDVSITHLSFGQEYTSAVEAKQVAQQEAERAKFVVEKATQEKRSAIIRAEGEAQSARLIGNAIANNPAFISLRRIDAARDIAHVMSNSANRIYLTSDQLLLNAAGLGQAAVSADLGTDVDGDKKKK